jgi:hypothetical protein
MGNMLRRRNVTVKKDAEKGKGETILRRKGKRVKCEKRGKYEKCLNRRKHEGICE